MDLEDGRVRQEGSYASRTNREGEGHRGNTLDTLELGFLSIGPASRTHHGA
jgi:hypothetical protein